MSISSVAFSAYIHGVDTKITRVSTFGKGVVTGDLFIQVEDSVAGCEKGYYLRSENAGKNGALSIALSAYHSAAKVKIHAYDSPRWPGSSGNTCEIESISLVK
tara:strand:+ start:156 stop:464 length:309 start_codon:yes stop_codon:yes gene_type:complete